MAPQPASVRCLPPPTQIYAVGLKLRRNFGRVRRDQIPPCARSGERLGRDGRSPPDSPRMPLPRGNRIYRTTSFLGEVTDEPDN